jgi:hypothetical protein
MKSEHQSERADSGAFDELTTGDGTNCAHDWPSASFRCEFKWG